MPRYLRAALAAALLLTPMACTPHGAATATGPAPAAPVTCGPRPKGLESILMPGALTVFGEVHGTVETPAFVANVACLAAAAGDAVAIGLEVPSHLQEDVDRFLDSKGAPADVEALLTDEHWKAEYGNASRALLSLMQEVRALRQSGKRVRVFFFDVNKGDPGERDPLMAAHIAAQTDRDPRAVTLVLTGNLHARADSDRWMAWHLAKSHPGVRTLNVAYPGGSAYICVDDTHCGVRGDLSGKDRGSAPFVELYEKPDEKGYGGVFYLGVPVTPSAPVKHEGPLEPLPVPVRTQAESAYRARDYKACARLFLDSAAATPGPAGAQDLYGAACCASMRGDVDAAAHHLKEAIDRGFGDLTQLQTDPDLAALRADSRWQLLLRDAEAHTKAAPAAARP